jgi:DNA recombination protein RmuC
VSLPRGTLAHVEWLVFLIGLIGAALGAAVASLALAVARRRDPPGSLGADALARSLGHLQAEVARLGRGQDEVHVEVLRAREASLRELGQAAQGLRGEIGEARRTLAEVKALERARGSQLDRATDSLRRLEVIVAGSASRGAAGENILGRALGQLPPDLLERNASFGGRVVEYALRLPGGRLLPIDSKWTGAGDLERLETTSDPDDQRRLHEQLSRDVRLRVREMVRYLDPERTLALAVLAIPDAVHAATPEAHAEGWSEGVLVVPYSLALPFVLSLYRLVVRLGSVPEGEGLASALARLADSLRRLDDEVEGRLSRGLVQAANARDALRGELAGARRTVERLAGDGPTTGVAPRHVGASGSFDPPRPAG